jgi:hypothetical protein
VGDGVDYVKRLLLPILFDLITSPLLILPHISSRPRCWCLLSQRHDGNSQKGSTGVLGSAHLLQLSICTTSRLLPAELLLEHLVAFCDTALCATRLADHCVPVVLESVASFAAAFGTFRIRALRVRKY